MTKVHAVYDGSFARFRGTFTTSAEIRMFQKALDGARYVNDGKRRGRMAPLDKVPSILDRLRGAGFDVQMDQGLRSALNKTSAQEWLDRRGVRERITTIDTEIRALTGEVLFPFQKTGAEWLALRQGALLADDMGLGKTREAIVALPAGAAVLVVCNSAAKGVWAGEVAKCRPHIRVRVLQGRDSFRWPKVGEMIVTNYDILPEVHDSSGANGKRRCTGKMPPLPCPGCKEELVFGTPPPRGAGPKPVASIETRMGHKPSCKGFREAENCPGCHPLLTNEQMVAQTVMIGDEAHYIKNGQSSRTLRFRALAEAVRRKDGRTWLLTGTPMENEPKELWSVFQAAGIAHEAFGDWKTFVRLFKGKASIWGYTWDTPDKEIPEIVERARRVMLRRMKSEVLPDLPTKLWQEILVDVDKETIAECDSYLQRKGGIEYIMQLLEKEELNFQTMSSVRAALATAKIPAMLEIVREHEEMNEPLLVFSAHRTPIDFLGRMKGWAIITGDEDNVAKTAAAEKFQRGELKGLGLTIRAGGTSLTLTRACRELFVDRDWKPTANAQAEDRAVRIGQTRGVVVMILKANHPLDRRVNELLLKKQRLISASVDAASCSEDAPLTDKERAFDLEIAKIQKTVLTDTTNGVEVLRQAAAGLEEQALDELRKLEFDNRVARVVFNLIEGSDTVGLSDAQWSLVVKIAAGGRGRPVTQEVQHVEDRQSDADNSVNDG